MMGTTYGGLASFVLKGVATVPLYVSIYKEAGMAMCNTEMPPRYKKMHTTFGTAAGTLS